MNSFITYHLTCVCSLARHWGNASRHHGQSIPAKERATRQINRNRAGVAAYAAQNAAVADDAAPAVAEDDEDPMAALDELESPITKQPTPKRVVRAAKRAERSAPAVVRLQMPTRPLCVGCTYGGTHKTQTGTHTRTGTHIDVRAHKTHTP